MDLLKCIELLFIIQLIPIGDGHRSPRASNCPKLSGFNGRRIKYRRNNSRAVFKCNQGWERYGPKRLNCQRDGTWDAKMPICIKSGCKPVDISQSEYLDMKESYGGALLQFSCEAGYHLLGAPETHCDGHSWNKPIPKCEATSDLTECNFEAGLCGWSQDDTDQGDWTLNAGATQTGNTGPKFDHTHMDTATGHYLYFEASNPSSIHDQARLISPEYTDDMSPMCFDFWYHILGPDDPGHVGSLELFVRGRSEFLDDLQPLFYKEGNQGDAWHRGQIIINEQTEPYQIVIEATRKLSYISDIAIDDLRLYNCSEEKTTSTESTIIPTTTTTTETTSSTESSTTASTTIRTSKTTKSTTVAKPTNSTTARPATSIKQASTKSANPSTPPTDTSTKTSVVITNTPKTIPPNTLTITSSKATVKSSPVSTTLEIASITSQSMRSRTSPFTAKTTMQRMTKGSTTKRSPSPKVSTTQSSSASPTSSTAATTSTKSSTTTTASSSTITAKSTTTSPTTKTSKAAATSTTIKTTTILATTTTRPKPTVKKSTPVTTVPKTITSTTKPPADKTTTLISDLTKSGTKSTQLPTKSTHAPSTSSTVSQKTSSKKTAVVTTSSMKQQSSSTTIGNVNMSSDKPDSTTITAKTTAQNHTTQPGVSVAVQNASEHPADETLKPLMIGLGVGIIAGLIIIGVVAYVCVRRRKFYTSRYEDELKPITNAASTQSINNVQYYHDDEYEQ